jgi:hypothetical protein
MQMTPGRIAALAAGVPFAVALIGWTSYDFVALAGQASYTIARTIPVHGGGVTANVGGSDLTLRQGGVGTPELVGTVHYSLFKPSLTVTQAGAGTTVDFQCRDVTGNCSLNATLQVPPRIGVTLSTGGGNVSVPVFTGSAELLTGGGDVTAGSLGGTVQMQTGGGNVDADSLSGSLDLQTNGGDLNADTVSGDTMLTAGTGGGNVNVQDMADPYATIQSNGGDVTLTFTQVPRNLQISTEGGNILVVLPPGSTAYDLQANPGGGSVNVSHSVPTAARSSDSLILDSEGGDITVSEAS